MNFFRYTAVVSDKTERRLYDASLDYEIGLDLHLGDEIADDNRAGHLRRSVTVEQFDSLKVGQVFELDFGPTSK